MKGVQVKENKTENMKKNISNKTKLILFGPYPLPYGGVSVHIQRLSSLLKSHNIDCYIYDICYQMKKDKNILPPEVNNWFNIFHLKKVLVHIHNSEMNLKKILPLVILLKLRGNRIIMTYHSLSEDISTYNFFKKRLFQFHLRFFDRIIVVNSLIQEKIIKISDGNIQCSKKIEIIPAFIHPSLGYVDKNSSDGFIKNHIPIISANAAELRFHNRLDLYGVDMCIDLCSNLKKIYPHIGFIFSLAKIGDDKYFSYLKQKITNNKIENNFVFITEPHQFYPLLVKSDVFVRPTNTDGDAISLREALYFKIPSVASDVIERPKSTILFRNRDDIDFLEKVKLVLEKRDIYCKELESEESIDFFNDLYRLYLQIFKQEINR